MRPTARCSTGAATIPAAASNGFYLDNIEVRSLGEMGRGADNLRVLYWNIQNGMWSGQGDNYTRFVDWVNAQNPDVCVWCESVTNYKTASDEKIKPEEAYLPEHWGELAGATDMNIGIRADTAIISRRSLRRNIRSRTWLV